MTATLTRTVCRAAAARVRGSGLAAADDRDLIARVADGDHDAWGELYRRHRATVTGYVRNRVPANVDVEDLVHDGFLLARDMAGDYRQQADPDYTVRAWLCGRAGQAIRQNAWSRHAYLQAADASRTTVREPVTETAAERERQSLSEPMLHALAQLPPAQRRAIQLRYLDGLSVDQAAEVGGCSPRAILSSSEVGRRKLSAALAELAPQARSPLQDMPRHEAARTALETVGYDNVAGAQAWLRERGVQVSTTTMYEVRRDPNRPRPATHTPRAYTAPEQIRGLPPTERARAAGRDYRTHHDQLPSISQLAAATGVSHPTAARALRQLKAEHHAPEQLPDQHTRPTTPTDDRAPHAAGDFNDAADGHVGADATSDRHAATTRSAPPHLRDGRLHQPDTSICQVPAPRDVHRARPRHRVEARTGRTEASTTDTSRHAQRRGWDEDCASAQDRTRADLAPRADVSAEVSIARARAAVAVLAAHRAVQAQRRQAELNDADQAHRAARWHADDQYRTRAEARADAEGIYLQ